MYECKICGRVDMKRQRHSYHILSHFEEKPFLCEIKGCGESFKSRNGLDVHLSKHSEVQEFKCDICEAVFNLSSALEKHKSIHDENKKIYNCKYCSGTFRRTFEWKAHEKRHNPQKEKLKACDHCDNVYLNILMLNNHKLKVHGIEIKYKSRIVKARQISDEIRENNEVDKSFRCRFCSEHFKEMGDYRKHEEDSHIKEWKEYLLLKLKDEYHSLKIEAEFESEFVFPPTVVLARKILTKATSVIKWS